jgi:predicted nucleotidyltransferase
MKTLDEIRNIIREHRNVPPQKYRVAVVGVFGSYVRSAQKDQSDIDLLTDILRTISLLELLGAEIYLSEVPGTRVDLVPKRDVREELRETIFGEAAKNVPDEIRAKYPSVRWKEIAGMRDKVIHLYFGVDREAGKDRTCEDNSGKAENKNPCRGEMSRQKSFNSDTDFHWH